MPKENEPPPIALPARASLVSGVAHLEIAVLLFPFAKTVADFCQDIEQVLSGGRKREYPTYRQLNNGLLACAPTLTYGFEYFDQENYVSQYRALAVGTPENPIRTPTPDQMQELVQIWAQEWTKRFHGKGKKEEVDSVCARFIERMEVIPQDWEWQSIKPETLIRDINAERGLGFQAIPSLLVTLLHGKSCVIRGNREQELQWRKVQGDGAGKVGLFLVSQPFRALYSDNGKEKEGYFAYRLDFRIETQAGRFNKDGKLEPWIFLHLSCQRYAHEPLVNPNYGRDISILMGMNEERLSGYEVDSTLVRLVIDNSSREDGNPWKFQLPNLLAAFKARALEKPENILRNPAAFSNLDNQSDWHKDEYYLVHAEGYEYEHENHKRGHSIKTGFSFQERGDIIARVLELLNGVLIPDNPMACDIPAPSGKTMPLAMRDYDFISTPPTFTREERERLGKEEREQRVKDRRRDRQPIVTNAIWQALHGKPMHLFLLWRERDTYQAVYQHLRDAFLLNEDDNFPEHVSVISVLIDDATLLKPLDTGGFAPKDGSKFDDQIRKQHQAKREAWRKFLKQHVIPLINPDADPYRFAIIEIGQSKKKGVHPRQSIKGAVREACVLEKISSQMLQTVKPKSTEQEDENRDAPPSYSKKTKGRVMSAVLDVTLRQIGALYGLPSEVYQQAKLPKAIAQELDVIALCRRKTNQFQGNIHYTLAVRLRATGAVDVLLPDANEWIPYAQAGIVVGQIFSQARRRDRLVNRKRINSKILLTGKQLAQFAARVLTQVQDRPTLVLIEADGWRNERGEDDEGKVWFQLKNEYLLAKRNVLDFQHITGHNCEYLRDNDQLNNLLAVVRLRTGKETPQYITNRKAWSEDCTARDFIHLSGFYDTSVPGLLHYFSVGRLPETQKAQDTTTARELYMLDYYLHESNSRHDEYGANIPFKHQQMVEIVPFFVHPDFQTEEGLKALCRVPHYLRFSPAWSMGNILLPYPMHLGEPLIEDHLCILGIED